MVQAIDYNHDRGDLIMHHELDGETECELASSMRHEYHTEWSKQHNKLPAKLQNNWHLF
jgi:hypothetical protein